MNRGVVSIWYNVRVKTFPDGHKQYFWSENYILRDVPEEFRAQKLRRKFTEPDNEGRFPNNMKRAVNQVYDLARANHFDWFITLTFNPDIVDRTNYDECAKLIVLFTKKLRRNGNAYIIVPELHSDGKSYHFHGLVQGELDLTHWKGEVYNLNSFEFGYTTAMEIRDPARVATYIAKYLTKELSVPKGRKCYFFGVPGRSVDIPHKRIARHIHILHRGLSQTPRGPIDAGEYGRFIIAEE